MSLYLTRQFSFYRIHLNIPETSKYADPFPCMLFIGSFPAHILEWKRSCPPLFFSRQFIDPCHEGIRPRPLQQNRYDTLAAFKDDFISPMTKSLSIIVEPFSATVRLSIFAFVLLEGNAANAVCHHCLQHWIFVWSSSSVLRPNILFSLIKQASLSDSTTNLSTQRTTHQLKFTIQNKAT